MYIYPDVEIQQFQEPEDKIATTGAVQKNLTKKPHALKNKGFASFSEIADRDFLRWLLEKGDEVMDKISRQHGVVSFKDLTVSAEK